MKETIAKEVTMPSKAVRGLLKLQTARVGEPEGIGWRRHLKRKEEGSEDRLWFHCLAWGPALHQQDDG